MPQFIPESLENRRYFAALPPSAEETYEIELINRDRANPTLAALRYGISLNEGLAGNQISTTAKQPVALNAFLIDSSYGHAVWMQQNGQVSLVGANGTLPQDRMIAAGYPFTGTSSSAESVQELPATKVPPPSQTQIDQMHANWFQDVISNTRQDRINMMTDGLEEAGAGFSSGPFGSSGGGGGQAPTPGPDGIAGVIDYAVSTGNTGGDQFLVGVAYNDANANGFYDIGEGLRNVTVSARRLSDNVIFSTTTYGPVVFADSGGANSGAYTLRLPAGIYDVTATGGGLGNVQVQYPAVVVNTRNVKRDFTPQQQTSPPSPPPSGGGVIPPGTPSPITLRGDLKGKVWVDKNGDGKKDKEVDRDVIFGVKVYLDLNKNGQRDSNEQFGTVLVSQKGTWRIVGVSPGIYQVGVEAPTGYRVSIPDEGFRTVTVVSGKQKSVKTFLVTPRTIISGTVFRDDNGDGIFQENVEKGRKDWRVYLDLNNDGVWQRETEPSRKTDSQGKYSFRDLLPATYTLRVIPQVGYLQTLPANNGFYVVQLPSDGLSVMNRDFGEKKL